MQGVLLGMALLWLGGCASADGRARAMEADWGRSVTNNRLEMMVTPPDAVDPRPAVGMPPQTAQNVQDRYDKSFKEKEKPAPIIQIIGQ
jgi:hypothetical protein